MVFMPSNLLPLLTQLHWSMGILAHVLVHVISMKLAEMLQPFMSLFSKSPHKGRIEWHPCILEHNERTEDNRRGTQKLVLFHKTLKLSKVLILALLFYIQNKARIDAHAGISSGAVRDSPTWCKETIVGKHGGLDRCQVG